MKWRSVNSANKGNRSNNLGGTIMVAMGSWSWERDGCDGHISRTCTQPTALWTLFVLSVGWRNSLAVAHLFQHQSLKHGNILLGGLQGEASRGASGASIPCPHSLDSTPVSVLTSFVCRFGDDSPHRWVLLPQLEAALLCTRHGSTKVKLEVTAFQGNGTLLSLPSLCPFWYQQAHPHHPRWTCILRWKRALHPKCHCQSQQKLCLFLVQG